MKYVFLIVAAAWTLQFLLSYWQLRNFHLGLAQMRKLGRCAVGLDGNRWRGRVYGVLVLDRQNRVCNAAIFSGWTVFSRLKPVYGIEGMTIESVIATSTPPTHISPRAWRALQHAAQFFTGAAHTKSAPHIAST